jgi:hypothetical protein
MVNPCVISERDCEGSDVSDLDSQSRRNAPPVKLAEAKSLASVGAAVTDDVTRDKAEPPIGTPGIATLPPLGNPGAIPVEKLVTEKAIGIKPPPLSSHNSALKSSVFGTSPAELNCLVDRSNNSPTEIRNVHHSLTECAGCNCQH